jgi:surface protein
MMNKRYLLYLLPVVILAASSDDYVIKVKTDNTGVSNSNEFTIPVVTTQGNGYNVDCNDDGIDEVTGATTTTYPDGYTCVYASAGTYTVRVKDNNGDGRGFRRIRFYIDSSTTTDVLKLLEINQWGTAVWSSMSQAYRGAENLTVTPSDIPDLSQVSSLRQMFYGCSNADIKTGGWDTSTITNLTAMFRDATSADPDVSGWDTSSVTNMSQLFYNAASANPDVSGWDTSSVTRMDALFREAVSALPDTSGWNTSQVTHFNNMFRDAVQANPDVSGWDTSQVTSMYGMFYGATNASPVTTTNGNIWNTSQVTDMAYMFQDATHANPDTSGWDTSQVTTMRAMFKNATSATPDTSGWNTGNVTTMRAMFNGASSANPDVSHWNTSQVTSMLSMFKDAAKANPDVTNWDVSSVTSMANMFQNAVTFDRNLQYWDVSNVTSFVNFLSGAKLSTYNYDALLKSWVNLTLSDGERFDAGDSTYCTGEQARSDIIANDNWDIRDAGKSCPGPCEEVNRQLNAMHWVLISFPCDTGSNGVEALLGGALGTYGDDGDWVMYEQTGADNYIGENTQKRMLSSTDTVIPGKGYWIISASDANMTIDTTLPNLNYTSVQAASNLGISSSVFDDLNMTQLPDSDASDMKKVALGNPFPQNIQLSDVYFSHSGAVYTSLDDNSSGQQDYFSPTVYTYEHTGTSNANYVAISADTPGFSDRIDPMTGFFMMLKAASSGTNNITFPYEK